MTSIETIDPKTLRTAVEGIAAKIEAHHKAVARRNAKCAAEGNNLKQELSDLAHQKPAALGEYIERNTNDFKVLYDQSGDISGYRTRGGFLSLFHVDHTDKDLQQYIAVMADKSVDLCRNRSR